MEAAEALLVALITALAVLGALQIHFKKAENERVESDGTTQQQEQESLSDFEVVSRTPSLQNIPSLADADSRWQPQLAALAADLAKKSADVDRLQAELAVKAVDFEHLELELVAKSTALDQLQTKLDEKSSDFDRLKTDLSVQAAQCDSLQTKLALKSTDFERMQNELTGKSTLCDTLQTELALLKASTGNKDRDRPSIFHSESDSDLVIVSALSDTLPAMSMSREEHSQFLTVKNTEIAQLGASVLELKTANADLSQKVEKCERLIIEAHAQNAEKLKILEFEHAREIKEGNMDRESCVLELQIKLSAKDQALSEIGSKLDSLQAAFHSQSQIHDQIITSQNSTMHALAVALEDAMLSKSEKVAIKIHDRVVQKEIIDFDLSSVEARRSESPVANLICQYESVIAKAGGSEVQTPRCSKTKDLAPMHQRLDSEEEARVQTTILPTSASFTSQINLHADSDTWCKETVSAELESGLKSIAIAQAEAMEARSLITLSGPVNRQDFSAKKNVNGKAVTDMDSAGVWEGEGAWRCVEKWIGSRYESEYYARGSDLSVGVVERSDASATPHVEVGAVEAVKRNEEVWGSFVSATDSAVIEFEIEVGRKAATVKKSGEINHDSVAISKIAESIEASGVVKIVSNVGWMLGSLKDMSKESVAYEASVGERLIAAKYLTYTTAVSKVTEPKLIAIPKTLVKEVADEMPTICIDGKSNNARIDFTAGLPKSVVDAEVAQVLKHNALVRAAAAETRAVTQHVAEKEETQELKRTIPNTFNLARQLSDAVVASQGAKDWKFDVGERSAIYLTYQDVYEGLGRVVVSIGDQIEMLNL